MEMVVVAVVIVVVVTNIFIITIVVIVVGMRCIFCSGFVNFPDDMNNISRVECK